MIEWAWSIPLFPLGAFLVISFATRPWRRLSGYVAVAGILASLAVAVAVFGEVLSGARVEGQFNWLPLAGGAGQVSALPGGGEEVAALPIGFIVDPLAAVMLLVVTSVSFLVIFYSQGYLHGDPGYSRYFAFISLFCMSMLGLVLANNLLALYVFWELVGLCSYLLIGFWYQKPEAAAAAKKAFIVTRLGDFGLLVGILLLWSRAGTLEFGRIEGMIAAGQFDPAFMTLVALLIFCGAVGKSAQFPLHVWLPDAMEGPTPVSALIHAATMVAAGVYLVARTFPIFEAGPASLAVVAFLGTLTAIMAASMALVTHDIKRVLAYSTISQLGYMMLALGLGARDVAMFHLMNHAFFKALLFLGAGSLIHSLGTQDLRLMGGLGNRMRITAGTMLAGALSLSGFPLLTSGFWSKDEILATAFERGEYLLFVVGLVTAFLTALYMSRAWLLAFWGEPRWARTEDWGLRTEHSSPITHHPVHESPWVMTAPLVALAVPSLLSGFWGSPLLGNGFAAFLEGHAVQVHLNPGVMLASMAVALGGIYLGWALYGERRLAPDRISSRVEPLYRLLVHRYWIDEAYEWLVRAVVLRFARLLGFLDTRVIDGVVNGVGTATRSVGPALRQLQTGRLQSYGWAMYAGLVVIAVVTLLAQYGR